MIAEGAPDTEAARSISWLVVNEIDAWFVGGRRLAADDKPEYVVRVSVPAGSMNDGKRRDIVRRVTRVLADADTDPERFTRATAAWVHIDEIPEDNWGAGGEIVRIADITALVTSGQVFGPGHAAGDDGLRPRTTRRRRPSLPAVGALGEWETRLGAGSTNAGENSPESMCRCVGALPRTSVRLAVGDRNSLA